MQRDFSKIQLSIRQKVMVVFTLCVAAVLLIGMLAYRDLVRLDRKLQLGEITHNLHYFIMEARRYEKSFLLNGKQKDYQEGRLYLQRAQEVFGRIQQDLMGPKGAGQLAQLEQEFAHHEQHLKVLATEGEGSTSALQRKKVIEARLNKTGNNLVDLSLNLSTQEYSKIQEIVSSLKTMLFSTIIVLFVMSLFLALLITRKIVRPLTVIEKTTQRIARGNFKPLPVVQTYDETQAVVEAFNTMITELESRQDQLAQAQKLSSLGILTSGIAHQLNNPLNNISTSCQILLEEIDDGDRKHVKKLLTNIDQEVDRSRDIVKGLLDFSREHEFELDRVNLQDLANRTTWLVSSQLPAGVEITTDIPEELDIYADAQKLQEVILNLLWNAAQAMPDGRGLITITAQEDSAVNKIAITVQDNGSGIPPEDLPHIFDPFFSTKEAGYGTGLGLSVAHGIVDRHGGTLSVTSKMEEGSAFTISLPLERDAGSGDQEL
ncbi:MAG: HAMP domain-containing protein [Deltaproteobacteria bacterium]|nr:MAG: HAMP domain-containing protein [Deltaproteobacteria bacterium]